MLNDPGRVTLAFQGGAMRVAHSLGVVRAISEAGLEPGVAAMYCSSAGTVGALGMLAEDIGAFSESLFERLSGRRFIDSRRLKMIVDVDYLVDVVGSLLDERSVARLDEVDVSAALVDADTGLMTYARMTPSNWRDHLRATMAIPILYGREVHIGARRYVDGGVGDSIPLAAAIQAYPDVPCGAILTRPAATISDVGTDAREAFAVRWAPGVPAQVRLRLRSKSLLDQASESWLRDGRLGLTPIVSVDPSATDAAVSRTCTDMDVLRRLLQNGFERGRTFAASLQATIGGTTAE